MHNLSIVGVVHKGLSQKGEGVCQKRTGELKINANVCKNYQIEENLLIFLISDDSLQITV